VVSQNFIRERLMTHRAKIIPEQFYFEDEDAVIHRPTKARFYARPGSKYVQGYNLKKAGHVLHNGSRFDAGIVFNTAADLLASRPSLRRTR
jgi:hypothetical protein